MFLLIKNSLRYVSITPCNRNTCVCFRHVKQFKGNHRPTIDQKWYDEYKVCFKDSKNPNEDIFLL